MFCKWEFNKDCVRNRVEQNSEEYRFRKLGLPHECVIHLFWECPETKKAIELLGGKVGFNTLHKTEFLLGIGDGTNNTKQTLCIVYHWVKFWIYKQKILGKGISTTKFENDWQDMMFEYRKNRYFNAGMVRVIGVRGEQGE